MARLTPLEIQRATFSRKLQGVDPEAVRDYLGQIAEQVEDDARQRGELKNQIAHLNQELDEHRARVGSLNETLLAAQKTAEATVGRAEAEGQRIVAEAQNFADRVIDEATRRVENIELVIGQLRARRRAARADLTRLADLLNGSARDDETAEERDKELPSVALLRPRASAGKASQ